MKLYLAHSSGYDYVTELYEPLKAGLSTSYEIFFPHDTHKAGVNSKEIIPTCDVVIAEVSYPSTGQGIELGWADLNNVPIICFFRTGASASSALRFICSTIVEYETAEDMVTLLRAEIEKAL